MGQEDFSLAFVKHTESTPGRRGIGYKRRTREQKGGRGGKRRDLTTGLGDPGADNGGGRNSKRTDFFQPVDFPRMFKRVIHHSHIDHNAPCLPPRILYNHSHGYAKFWGVDKVHYGLFDWIAVFDLLTSQFKK